MDPTFEWDDEKAQSNLAKHGVSFEVVRALDWSELVVKPDGRFDYDEQRWRALSVAYRLVIVFTIRGDLYRIISVRRAHGKEIRRWAGLS